MGGHISMFLKVVSMFSIIIYTFINIGIDTPLLITAKTNFTISQLV